MQKQILRIIEKDLYVLNLYDNGEEYIYLLFKKFGGTYRFCYEYRIKGFSIKDMVGVKMIKTSRYNGYRCSDTLVKDAFKMLKTLLLQVRDTPLYWNTPQYKPERIRGHWVTIYNAIVKREKVVTGGLFGFDREVVFLQEWDNEKKEKVMEFLRTNFTALQKKNEKIRFL